MFQNRKYMVFVATILLVACSAPIPPKGILTPSPTAVNPSPTPEVSPQPGVTPSPIKTADRPNIVVVMVDDLGYMSQEYQHLLWSKMPTLGPMFLDHGVEFTNYQGQDPLCCPGRANFLSGQTADHTLVKSTGDGHLFDDSETIATEVSGAGYWTAFVGKYLNGIKTIPDKTPDGWDQTLIADSGYSDIPAWKNGKQIRIPGYTTSFYTKTALEFLEESDPNKPALMMLWPFAVHSNGQPKSVPVSERTYMPRPEDKYRGDARCSDLPFWKPPSYNESNTSDKPLFIQNRPKTGWVNGWPLKKICETLLSVDDMVKQVKSAMEAQERSNTLWILTDDNGMTFGAHKWATKDVAYATPMPLYFYWEGSDRLGVTPREELATVMNIDFAPTLCELAECLMDNYKNGFPVDGLSFLPVLLDQQDEVPNRDFTYHQGEERPYWHSVRTTTTNPMGMWEFTLYADSECELYDLNADPWELQNFCNKPRYSKIQTAMQDALTALMKAQKKLSND